MVVEVSEVSRVLVRVVSEYQDYENTQRVVASKIKQFSEVADKILKDHGTSQESFKDDKGITTKGIITCSPLVIVPVGDTSGTLELRSGQYKERNEGYAMSLRVVGDPHTYRIGYVGNERFSNWLSQPATLKEMDQIIGLVDYMSNYLNSTQ